MDFIRVFVISSDIFSQDIAELLHPVVAFIQLIFYSIEEPFFYQPLLILAFSKQLRKTRLLFVDFLNNILPFAIIYTIFCKLSKVLPALRRVVHIIAKKLVYSFLFILIKHLVTSIEAFNSELLFITLDNRQVIYILLTWLGILADKIYQLQLLFVIHILALTHHHSCKAVTGVILQYPFHHNKRWFRCSKIAGKTTLIKITVTLLYKWCRQKLHQYGLTTTILQGNQSASAIKVQCFITDMNGIMVIIYINQPNSINLAHFLPLLKFSAPAQNYFYSTDSSP